MFCIKARVSRILVKSSFKTFDFTRTMSMLVEKVNFASENAKGECPAVFVKGKDSSSSRGLIVLQEWWGMNQQIQDQAAEIAEKGDFVALVPDLYRGKVATDHETAGHYMNDLDWPGAIQDITGAAKYLLSKGCTKVGVTGFCMGGALSLASAALVSQISASAPFYGIPGEALCDVSKIKIPIQCHFGELDDLVGFSSPKDVEALKAKLEAGGVNFEIHNYKAGHAFTHKGGAGYNKEACELSLQRMMDFMKKNI
ncbi:uncharacterized protein LOC114520569 [Dendronephthya gigantea]|uniref:uncharacterized protein LOC114520569 n=1 Tax=Dendronephthya gigantea TaxID=151771 RepID=UPI00106AA12A|nr:uncharacterized protein LOC114520569 [Dendronephthya gigantea]